jgi:uroporphyrinogen-III synthase
MGPATASCRPSDAVRPLRALVTRPREEAAGLAAALAGRGIEAVLAPLIEVAVHAGPAPDLAGAQAILCTSANGVRALAGLSPEREVPLFAVGERTAARARGAGFARVESAGGNVADLARLAVARLDPAAGRLVHVAGSVVAGDLAGDLRDRGFTVERLMLYEARPAAALDAAATSALAAGAVDFALFFSPRTAALFAELAARAGLLPALRRVTAISISAAADAALGGHFGARHIAERPDQTSLLLVLDRLLDKRPPA